MIFTGLRPGLLRRTHPGQHLLITVRHARDAGEALGIDRVHRNRHARQAGVGQRLRHFGEKMSIGGDGDVEPLAFDGLHLAKLAHHLDQSLAQQRLAAGQADLGDAQPDEDARHAQVVGDRHLRKLRAVAARAAIDAPVVAAVGDGDSQIADAPSVFVREKHAVRSSPFAVRQSLFAQAADLAKSEKRVAKAPLFRLCGK